MYIIANYIVNIDLELNSAEEITLVLDSVKQYSLAA